MNVNTVECDICTHEWLASYPDDLEENKLECPNCENLTFFTVRKAVTL